MSLRIAIVSITAVLLMSACTKDGATPKSQTAAVEPSADEAAAIGEEAYIYAFPMMENYRTMYVQAVDRSATGYMGGFNELVHKTELLGPEFKDIVRPNNDTMYSFAWLDLRAQPVVITLPAIENRYYSVQLVDMFTHNLGYIGTRTTGTNPGSYVVAGPEWNETKPKNTAAVLQSETSFVYCIIRTEVRGLDDVDAVRALQKQFRLTPLNVFFGRTGTPAAAGITFPMYDSSRAKSAEFIDLLNFLLTEIVLAPEEEELMDRFSRIGIRAGALGASSALSADVRAALDRGVGRAMVAIDQAAYDPSQLRGVTVREGRGWQGIAGLFGSGDVMRTKYLARAVAAKVGLYGNDVEEAYYPMTDVDASGQPLDGSKQAYVMRFEKDALPAVDAFWSMTMYSLPDQLMVDNPIARYSIGDRSKLEYGNDGSLTLYIQRDSPERANVSNWLPAPNGAFSLQFRMYLPKAASLDPLYLPPAVKASR